MERKLQRGREKGTREVRGGATGETIKDCATWFDSKAEKKLTRTLPSERLEG